MIKRATDVIGKPVVAADNGKKLGTVEDLLLDGDTNEVRGLLVGHGLMRGKDVLPASSIQSLGPDAVVSRSSALLNLKEWNRERREPSPRDLAERRAPLQSNDASNTFGTNGDLGRQTVRDYGDGGRK